MKKILKFEYNAAPFRGHVRKYAFIGLLISLGSILIAMGLVSVRQTGNLSLAGLILAQKTNPAIWALDLTPFLFAYWGQSFSLSLVNEAESIIEDKTRELTTKSSSLESQLQYESQHDSLTNLPNNRLFLQRIERGIQSLQPKEYLVIVVLSIDNIKDINYNYGNYFGNILLTQFAEKLKSLLLEPYMLQAHMGMNMVARLQGAEFAILFPRFRQSHNFTEIMNNIRQATSGDITVDGNQVHISVHAGVGFAPQHGKDEEELLNHAHLSLQHALSTNSWYAIYEENMSRVYQSKRNLLKEVNEAILNEDLQLKYQPIYDLNTHQLVGGQAVTYFKQDKLSTSASDKMLPLIEGTSLTRRLNQYMLNQGIKDLAHIHTINPDAYLRLTLFNASDIKLPAMIKDLLKKYNMSANHLRLELSEKVCLSDQMNSIKVLKTLSEYGIKIAINDFGSGYSAFSYLPNFPIEEIIIEKSFLTGMLEKAKKYQIVHAIVALSKVLNIDVIADGVTSDDIAKHLKQLGCQYAQGAHFGDPMAIHLLASNLQQNKVNNAHIQPKKVE